MLNLITGDIDWGLPSVVEFVIGGFIASVIDNYVPPWAQDLVTVLGDMSDILDDMKVESTVTFSGQECGGVYRGSERWDWITFTFRGTQLRVPPSGLPGVSEIKPDEFAAWYSCGELYIDRHKIENSLSQLVRFLLDSITNAVTGYPDIETALYNMVDCYSFAIAVDNYVYSVCSYCPVVTGIIDAACTGLKTVGIAKITEKIDEAAVKMSVIKRKGIGTVEASGTTLSNGQWYGALVGNDFPGEFTATKQ
jgi:hypothetical protein